MVGRRGDRQVRINSQFAEDVADAKTQILAVTQMLGAMTGLLDGLIERLVEKNVLAQDELILRQYRTALVEIERLGVPMQAPKDPEQEFSRVTCPECGAVLRLEEGQRAERCDWCGYQFRWED